MRFLAFAILVWLIGVPATIAGGRVALAIGNTNYQHTSQLPNAVRDAQRIGDILKRAGYTSATVRTDLSYDAMRQELLAFRQRAQSADVAVIFYAGHGIQVNSENYLVPTDARLLRESDAPLEAFSLSALLDAVTPNGGAPTGAAPNPFRVVILDACRTNTFPLAAPNGARRGSSRGFAPVGQRRNTVIAFSTAPNSVADDGAGDHSPYAQSLFKYLATPGLDVRKVFGFVYDDTMERTRNAQEPDLTVKLGGQDYFLVEGARVAPVRPAQALKTETFVVYFDFDKFSLTPAALAVVEAAAKRIKELSAKDIRVAGHSDGRSIESESGRMPEAYALKLSERMASNVAAALVTKGVEPKLVSVKAYGTSRLLAAGGTDVASAMNRRVEIEVFY